MKNEDVWFEAGSQDPEHWPVISAESRDRGERREDQEAAGFARKLDNAEEDPLMALSLSLFVASFVLSGSNKTQNSSQAANKLAAPS